MLRAPVWTLLLGWLSVSRAAGPAHRSQLSSPGHNCRVIRPETAGPGPAITGPMSRYHCCSQILFCCKHSLYSGGKSSEICWMLQSVAFEFMGDWKSALTEQSKTPQNESDEKSGRCQLYGRWYGQWLCDCVWLSIAVNVKLQSDYVIRSRKLSIHNHWRSALIQWNSGK